MLLILAGEGASDLGMTSNHGHRPGPMAVIVDAIISEVLGFSPLAVDRVQWVSRARLSEISKSRLTRPTLVIPGPRREAGYAMHAKHAAALSWVAMEAENAEQDVAIAVMFRDSDGTQTSSGQNWNLLVKAIKSGFEAMTFYRGVAMVPKPKQEAWLLCALKQDPYQHCAALEEESGNDSSPNSLKRQLAAVCDGEPAVETMCDWIRDHKIDIKRIDMPSFRYFLESLSTALTKAAGH